MRDAVAPVILFLVIAFGLFVWFRYDARQRTSQFRAVAGELGFTWSRGNDPALLARLEGFHLLSLGSAPAIENRMMGILARVPVTVLEYSHGSLTSHATTRYLVLVRETTVECGPFALRPRTGREVLTSGPGTVAGLERYPHLAGRYVLETSAPMEGVQPLLAHMELLAASHDQPALECRNTLFVYYQMLNGEAVSAETVRQLLKDGLSLYELLVG
jgi:hypothetical protein